MPLLALISQRSLTLAAKFGRKPVLADKARENALLIMMDVIIGLVGTDSTILSRVSTRPN